VSRVSAVSGRPNLLLGAYDLATVGYGAEEFFVWGTASSYASADEADCVTRMVVLTPTEKSVCNGTVIVEWLNVSGGSDTDPDFAYAAAEFNRSGYAYVGVSAQQAGIDGSSLGDVASQLLPGVHVSGLRRADPVRYGSLHHPGDAYSYDIFTQVARALRDPGSRPAPLLAASIEGLVDRRAGVTSASHPLEHDGGHTPASTARAIMSPLRPVPVPAERIRARPSIAPTPGLGQRR